MKDQLKLLLELQEFDLEGDIIRESKSEIDTKLNEYEQALAQLKTDLEGQSQQIEATAALLQEKSNEHEEVEERLKKSKGRLQKVSNTKEYAAIEQEIETAKRQRAQLEEELIQLKDAIDTSRESSAEKESKIEALREQVALEQSEAGKRLGSFDGRLAELDKRRQKITGDISKSLFRRYAFIRSRRDGRAVVPAHNGCCQGCFMQLPPQLYIEIQGADAFKSCPNCQRILYHEAAEDADSANPS